jgi:lysozyme family protein
MAIDGFERAYARVRVHEGGNVDDPRDPGGRTSRGVIQRVYDGYRSRKGLPKADVWEASDSEIAEIYRFQYWDKIHGDELPAGVDYVVFDGAVNSGCAQSVKWLQRALGVSNVDGVIGVATLEAVLNDPDNDALIARDCARRRGFLRALKTYPRFRRGWEHRVDEVQKVGQLWATSGGGDVPTATYAANSERRAFISDARSPPATAISDGATGGGSLTVALSSVQDQLQPLSGSVPYVDRIVAGLVLAGGLVAVGSLAYSFWARREGRNLRDALDLPHGATAQPA